VWHGTAQAVIDPQHINQEALGAAVQRMLATIPARGAASATSTSSATVKE
jgi:hypothetical protein